MSHEARMTGTNQRCDETVLETTGTINMYPVNSFSDN